jgi:RimJ/RimL family protein N-acetyltransferase
MRGLIGEVASMSKADSERFLEKARTDSGRAWFMVSVKENNKVIGEAGLLRIDRAWRTTDISVIIGEKEEWGKGYGTEAILLLLDYAFGHLNLHRVAIGVVGFNERALRFWAKIGFKREGVQRDGYYYDGKYHDFVLMSILEDEFRELHGAHDSKAHPLSGTGASAENSRRPGSRFLSAAGTRSGNPLLRTVPGRVSKPRRRR